MWDLDWAFSWVCSSRALSAGFNVVGGCIAKERVNLSEGRQENKLMVFSTMLTPVLFG